MLRQAVSIMVLPMVPRASNWLAVFSSSSNSDASCLVPYTATRMDCWPDLYTRYRLSRQLSTWSLFTTGLEKTWVPRFLRGQYGVVDLQKSVAVSVGTVGPGRNQLSWYHRNNEAVRAVQALIML